jgi:hypothetical protein
LGSQVKNKNFSNFPFESDFYIFMNKTNSKLEFLYFVSSALKKVNMYYINDKSEHFGFKDHIYGSKQATPQDFRFDCKRKRKSSSINQLNIKLGIKPNFYRV